MITFSKIRLVMEFPIATRFWSQTASHRNKFIIWLLPDPRRIDSYCQGLNLCIDRCASLISAKGVEFHVDYVPRLLIRIGKSRSLAEQRSPILRHVAFTDNVLLTDILALRRLTLSRIGKRAATALKILVLRQPLQHQRRVYFSCSQWLWSMPYRRCRRARRRPHFSLFQCLCVAPTAKSSNFMRMYRWIFRLLQRRRRIWGFAARAHTWNVAFYHA